jgi:hypothetical protein
MNLSDEMKVKFAAKMNRPDRTDKKPLLIIDPKLKAKNTTCC